MQKNIEEQKRLVVDAVLDLRQKFEAIEYLLDERKKTKNKITLEIFGDLFDFIYPLLWESVFINISWLYHKKDYEKNKRKNRGLFWYLEQVENLNRTSKTKVEEQLKEIESLSGKIEKVLRIRNKWVAHRDKVAFENPNAFFQLVNLEFRDVETLVETSIKIVRQHYTDIDLTTSGINIPFLFTETLIREQPKLEYLLKDYGLLDYMTKENAKELNQRDIEIINANADLINKQVEETLEFQAEW